MVNIFVKIGSGIKWTAKEIGKAFVELPKIITLTDDAKKVASDAIPAILNVLDEVKTFATASVADSGVFVTSLTALGGAIAAAANKDGIDIASDEAVLGAFEALVGDFKAANVAEILTAWTALVAAAEKLDTTVVTDLDKLKTDAG